MNYNSLPAVYFPAIVTGPLNVIGLKSQFGNGRKLTIEVREYFDSIHFTRRQGDERIVTNTDRPQESFGA